MNFSILRRFNFIQFFAMLALVAIGTIAIYSAGNARAETVFHDMWKGNLQTAAFALAIYFAIALTDYRRHFDILATVAYGLSILMLVTVLFVGTQRFGGRRWLWFFQPSEISKIGLLLFLAALFGRTTSMLRRFARPDASGFGLGAFLIACAVIGLPCLLILAEPDLGTALTLMPAAAVMLFVARVWRRGLIVLASTGALAALTILAAVYEAEKPGTPPERRERILSALPLKEHQLTRVKVYLFPESDVTGSGYNLRQAKISIGSGGLHGKGIGKGETNHLKYLPQAISMNDFIFCVYAEETGYVGTLALLALFAMLILPGCWIAYRATDGRGRLLALGISTLLFAHVYVNIAMSIGMVPITGLPLPFISSGRTFLVTVMAGLGFIQSISIHREEYIT